MTKKSKHPKSIVISFRLSPLVIAKAIDGLKNYDKTSDITRLSTIVKQTTLHGINYLTNALPWEASEESQRIVQVLTSQGKQNFSLENSILKPRSEAKEKPTKSYFEKSSQESNSLTSTVTDFSIPEELRQEIEEKEEKE